MEITTGTNRNMRLDHAIPNISSPVATLAKPAGPGGKIRHPCHAPLRAKMLELSNAFHKMFRFPLIHPTDLAKATSKKGEDRYQILPFISTPPAIANIKGDHRHHHQHHHKGGSKHRMEQASFLEHIHLALSALGPWEGKVVTFVIGCGTGGGVVLTAAGLWTRVKSSPGTCGACHFIDWTMSIYYKLVPLLLSVT
jgi:hypothetical protein